MSQTEAQCDPRLGCGVNVSGVEILSELGWTKTPYWYQPSAKLRTFLFGPAVVWGPILADAPS